VQKLL